MDNVIDLAENNFYAHKSFNFFKGGNIRPLDLETESYGSRKKIFILSLQLSHPDLPWSFHADRQVIAGTRTGKSKAIALEQWGEALIPSLSPVEPTLHNSSDDS